MGLKFLRPEILTHPNIPKPLHGVNPRSIKGKAWWDEVRQEAYAKNDYHCWACGTHKEKALYRNWLEAHESYKIDYQDGRVELEEIVALCHSCHNFIHSGRMLALYKKYKFKRDKACHILTRGLEMLEMYRLQPFHGARVGQLVICDGLNEKDATALAISEGLLPETDVAEWSRWHLVLDGEKHYTPYKDMAEWAEAWSN